MIGGKHVLTAGHCVFSHLWGGWATSIMAIPGWDGEFFPPFGAASMADRRASFGWTEDGDTPDYDYALITLDRSFSVGSFGLLHLSDDDLYDKRVCLIGYPGELGNPAGLQQFFIPGCDFLTAHSSSHVEHKIDTTKGNSGSPIYRFWEGKWAVLALHSTSVSPFVGSDYNAGPRITTHRHNMIRGDGTQSAC